MGQRHFDRVDDREHLRRRPRSVALCIPVFEDPVGIARTLDAIAPLAADGLLDQLLVIDGGSGDDTAATAAAIVGGIQGAAVVHAPLVLPALGPVLGKGDSMWRANDVIDAEVVVYLDADLANVSESMVVSLASPLVFGDEVDFVKGLFHRVTDRGDPREFDGGRVTELVARPLITLLCPELTHIYQPLGGQIAIRRSLMVDLPFVTGFGIEIAMLIDVARDRGLDRIGQALLGDLVNSEKAEAELAPMAQQVAYALLDRVGVDLPPWRAPVRPCFDGTTRRLASDIVVERPPWSTMEHPTDTDRHQVRTDDAASVRPAGSGPDRPARHR
ncbi:MAG: hypothetical protein R2698_03820 [Microthrixaceae bacterium]